MEVIDLKNISKSYGTLRVLNNISLEIESNRILTIMGPSGCGKTTLLRIIANLEQPSSGEVIYNDINIQDIGYIFQKLYVFPWLTVKQNVQFGIKIKGEEKEDEIDEILEYLGLAKFHGYYPYQISGGMLQRVAIARSLVLRPRLILMDEPFGDLDYRNKHQLYELIFDLKQKYGVTFILVTHDVNEALHIADTIVILSDRPASIKKKYQRIPYLNETNRDKLLKEILTILIEDS